MDAAGQAMVDLDSLGYRVLEHDADHARWAAGQAAKAVLVWARVVLGQIEENKRMQKARKRFWVMQTKEAAT